VVIRAPKNAPTLTFSGGVTYSEENTSKHKFYVVTATSTTSETVTIS
jgi:hypothetical protein